MQPSRFLPFRAILGCPEGDIRLLEGSTPLEGRVEVCNDNIWSRICDSNWNNVDARIVCRQLGFSDVGR